MYTKPIPTQHEIFQHFSTPVARDLLSSVCGVKLGTGISRTVYQCRLNADYVVKIELPESNFYNVHEWEVWSRFGHIPSIGQWLAPCHSISENGRVLIQRRTKTPGSNYKWPAQVPAWMTDTHIGNFGLIGKRLVCHDYGIHLGLERGISKRMKKATWLAYDS